MKILLGAHPVENFWRWLKWGDKKPEDGLALPDRGCALSPKSLQLHFPFPFNLVCKSIRTTCPPITHCSAVNTAKGGMSFPLFLFTVAAFPLVAQPRTSSFHNKGMLPTRSNYFPLGRYYFLEKNNSSYSCTSPGKSAQLTVLQTFISHVSWELRELEKRRSLLITARLSYGTQLSVSKDYLAPRRSSCNYEW